MVAVVAAATTLCPWEQQAAVSGVESGYMESGYTLSDAARAHMASDCETVHRWCHMMHAEAYGQNCINSINWTGPVSSMMRNGEAERMPGGVACDEVVKIGKTVTCMHAAPVPPLHDNTGPVLVVGSRFQTGERTWLSH